jgi:4-hydroxy-2-oxoheptanedioate aldolase
MNALSRLKASLAAREPVTLVTLQFPSLPLAEFVSAQGADAVFIDCEHGGPSIETVAHLAMAIRAGGATSIVRPWSADTDLLKRYIDCGIDGVIVPGVSGARAAARAIQAIRDTGAFDKRDVAVIALIETVEGLGNLEAIAAVPGVDGINIGSADLAVSMGLGRKPDEPRVRDAALDAFRRCRAAGRAAGAPVRRFGEAAFIANGGTIFDYNTADLLKDALSRAQADRAQVLTASEPGRPEPL